MLKLPLVQTWVVNRVTSYLSSELKSRVEVGSVNFEFFKKFVLNDVFIQDAHSDTLLFASNIKASVAFQTLFSENKKLILDEIQLNKARIELKRYKEDDGLSFQFLIDYFASSKEDTTAPKPFDFAINNIVLSECYFTYRDLRWDDKTPCIDFEDVDVQHVNATIENVKFFTDSVICDIEYITGKEKSGFTLTKLSSHALFSAHEMRFDDVSIETPYSKIAANFYKMEFDSIEDFYDYITRVQMKGDFKKSTLSSNDIQYFASELFGLDQTIQFEGSARGTVNNLKGKKLFIQFGKSSSFKGDVSLNGLPDVESTFLNLNIEKLTVNKYDIETIKLFPFTGSEHIALPENLATLGNATYKGVFTGFYNDFVAYGNIQTALGYLSTDLNLKFNPEMDKSSYSGKLVASEFDFGKFWSLDNIVGNATFTAQIKGSGFTSSKVNAKLTANVTSITLNRYTYHDIEMDGEVAKKLFNGSLNVEDKNLNLDFTGGVDFSKKVPEFNFSATIKDAALANLNLINRDTSVRFSADASLNMIGYKFDDLDGNFDVENIQYSELNKQIQIKSLSFSSSKSGQSRWLNLHSDVADASLNGSFSIKDVPGAIMNVLNRYMPDILMADQKINLKKQTGFTFTGKLKKTNDVFDIFVPGLKISDSTVFSGELNSLTGKINLNATAPFVAYNSIKAEKINILSGNVNDGIKFNTTSTQLFLTDSITLKNILIDGHARKTESGFTLKVLNTDSSNSMVNLAASQKYLPNGTAEFHFDSSTIIIEKKEWVINPGNRILFDSSTMAVNNLVFTGQGQTVKVDGNVSRNSQNKLKLTVENFNTDALKTILAVYNVSIGGTADGYIELANLYDKPMVTGEMSVKQFSFYNDTLGDAVAKMDWVTSEKKINFSGRIKQDDRDVVNVTGDYFFKDQNEMDFKFKVSKINMQPFNHYLSGLASNLRGMVTADLHLYGKTSEPFLTGTAKVQRGGVLIDYLNTRYSFTTENDIEFKERYIEFEKIELNDEGGNRGILNGRIYHSNLSGFVFDIDIEATKMQMLNTNVFQNELFYGKGYASGNISITGDIDIVNLKLNLKTEKGTQIFIPLSNPENIGDNDFIEFVTSDTSRTKTLSRNIDLSGIDMDFKLEATPDAEVQLLFDPKIGDVMRGRGRGDISMRISPAGDFSMYGDFNIVSGDYLFTLQNVINKKFTLQGGIISWSGSPYDAIIDITTKYGLRASTYDLVPDSSSSRGRVPVELLLNLKGNLMNPNVKFDINVPNTDPALQNAIKSKLSNDQDLNTQVFSLLVLNRFARSSNDSQTESSGNAVGQNVGELVSNQLSNWASQLSSTVDIGVNYRPGDALNSKDEFEVSLATELFSSRVSVEGNFGVANGSNQTSNIIGDFNVEFKINKDGNLRARAFNKTNSNNIINNLNSQYTQGIGVFYRREFNKRSELFEKKPKKKKEEVG